MIVGIIFYNSFTMFFFLCSLYVQIFLYYIFHHVEYVIECYQQVISCTDDHMKTLSSASITCIPHIILNVKPTVRHVLAPGRNNLNFMSSYDEKNNSYVLYFSNQQGIVKVGAVDADQHKSLGSKFGVTGYPTIKIFKGRDHSPYQGQRTASAMVEAALQAAKELAFARLGKKSTSGDKVKLLNILKPHLKGKITPKQQVIINKLLDYMAQQ